MSKLPDDICRVGHEIVDEEHVPEYFRVLSVGVLPDGQMIIDIDGEIGRLCCIGNETAIKIVSVAAILVRDAVEQLLKTQ